MFETITIGGAILIAACIILVLLPPKYDPAILWKERQMRHIQPEMRPGPKTWKRGNKADDTGEVLEPLRTRNDQPLCPNCGKPELLSGPSGGMSMNVACNSCLHEFNIGLFDSPPLVLEKRGKMTVERSRTFGITPEEYQEKSHGRDAA